jgi:glutathione peroxidase
MKTILSVLLILMIGAVASSFTHASREKSKPGPVPKSFYDFKMKAIDGTMIDFSKFKGKKVLLVNVASKCGFTPQYTDLQKLNEMYGDKVAILGFPANNFGGQEPGSNEEISQFCTKNYGVTFQMFEKISVKGDDMAPLYQWLTGKEYNGWNTDEPSWNFCKYLIDENGKLIAFFPSKVKPLDDDLVNKIKS